jgi:hypothetical protein
MKNNTSKRHWATPVLQIEEITNTGTPLKSSTTTREDATYAS